MTRTLTAPQKAAMASGKRRAARDARRDALKRVQDYERWLKAGSVLRRIPPIPTDNDYRTARAADRCSR